MWTHLLSVWVEQLSFPNSPGIWTSGSHASISTFRLYADPDSPRSLFLQLGAEQQVGEEEDVTEFPGTFHQLHHETIPQQLTVLPTGNQKYSLYTRWCKCDFRYFQLLNYCPKIQIGEIHGASFTLMLSFKKFDMAFKNTVFALMAAHILNSCAACG